MAGQASVPTLRHLAALLLPLLALAATACGRGGMKDVAVFDVQMRNVDSEQTLLAATLLVDGKEVGSFASEQPESLIVFGKRVDGIAPGVHVVEVRVDRQSKSPSYYAAGGAVGFSGHRLMLDETQANLETGGVLRMRIDLQVPTPKPAGG